jgi:parallel beta helix pectate lyase-like protein
MKKYVLMIIMLTVFVLLLATSGVASAQATRTWVSGVGDDANPCSRTAPCKTFAGAISKTAAAGEINVLDPGGFGAVTITKSITIDGGVGTIAGVLVSGTNGIVVSAGPSDIVYLRNLNIDGLNTGLAGIKFIAGGILNIQNVRVQEFTGAGIDFEPNQAQGSQLFVSDSSIYANTGGGILIKPAGGGGVNASLDHEELTSNLYGVRAEDKSNVTIRNTNAALNSNNGFLAVSAASPTVMMVQNSTASNTGLNGIATTGGGATIRLNGNTITNNGTGLNSSGGGQIISFGNNAIAGNGTDGAPTSTISLK